MSYCKKHFVRDELFFLPMWNFDFSQLLQVWKKYHPEPNKAFSLHVLKRVLETVVGKCGNGLFHIVCHTLGVCVMYIQDSSSQIYYYVNRKKPLALLTEVLPYFMFQPHWLLFLQKSST